MVVGTEGRPKASVLMGVERRWERRAVREGMSSITWLLPEAGEDGELTEEFAFREGLGGFGDETVEEVESADAVDDVVGRAQDEVAADGG